MIIFAIIVVTISFIKIIIGLFRVGERQCISHALTHPPFKQPSTPGGIEISDDNFQFHDEDNNADARHDNADVDDHDGLQVVL